MPSEVFRVSPIIGRNEVTVEDFNKLATELNKVLSEIAVAIGRTKGQDGATAKFVNDVDVDGNNILNVGKITFGARKHAKGLLPFVGEYLIDEPTDAPASVDALRDDITDNILPDIEAALNDLGSAVKRILDVLQI